MKRDILWAIVKSFIQGVSMGDCLKNIAFFAASVIARLASEGCALVLNTAYCLNSAKDFESEVGKLVKLVLG